MKKLILLFFPFLLFNQELEVRLQTQTQLPPMYLSEFFSETQPSEALEKWREILEYDLRVGGNCCILSKNKTLEKTLNHKNPRKYFSQATWKRNHIQYCLVAFINEKLLNLTVFNVTQNTSKSYLKIPLNRTSIHQLSDRIQKDLFGRLGVADLKLLYTIRKENPEKDGLDFLSEIWISDYDGKNAKQVTHENSYCLCPNFLPHSSNAFYYASEKTGQTKIYTASLTNPKGTQIVTLRGNQALPCISKDGAFIAYISDVAGRPDLFIQKITPEGQTKGKARQLFSAPRATQASPTFSPDGKQIAFVSDKDGPPRIYLMDVNPKKKNTSPRLLTRRNRENTSPTWAPDGTKLAYSAKVDGVRQIWIYDFRTNEEYPLTKGPGNKENPSWAPNSFHLVYNTENKDGALLYITNLNHSDPICIGKGRFASWQQNKANTGSM